MIIPEDFGQANLIFGGLDAPFGAQVTLGFANVGFFNATVAAEAVTAALVTAGVKGLYSASLSWDLTLVKLGPNVDGQSAVVTGGGVGTNGSQSEAPGVAALMHKSTVLGGRKGRGRSYWPGVPGSATVQTGQLTSGAVSLYQGVFDDILTAMLAEDVPMTLLHSDATAPSAVIGLTIDPWTATQRRRLRR